MNNKIYSTADIAERAAVRSPRKEGFEI